MKFHELEHVLRAAAGITGSDQFVIIESQAILGQFPQAPAEFLQSNEADIFTTRCVEDANLIDGSIGERSPFHQTFGYYAHGVAVETATLPAGWRDRLVAVRTPNTGGATGLCLEVHDLAVSKLVAGRDKDLEFVSGLIRHGLANAATIQVRLDATALDGARRELCVGRLQRASNAAY